MTALIQTIKCSHAKVYMTLFVYPEHVDRVAKVDSPAMQRLLDMPRRNPYPRIYRKTQSLPDIIAKSKQELREIVQAAIKNKPPKLAKSKVREKAETPVDVNVSKQVATPSEAPVKSTDTNKKPKPKSEYIGKLISHGFEERKMNNKIFKQFCVVLASDDLEGYPQKIWGTDLIDQFKNDQYKIGDHLKIVHLGKLPVNIDDAGKQTVKYRNVYTITSSSSY